MSIYDRYKFYLTHASIGTDVPINPINDTFRFAWSRKNKFQSLTKELASSLQFMGADYHLLNTLRINYPCDWVYLKVVVNCSGVLSNEFYRLSMKRGNWDSNNCFVELEFDNYGEDSCISVKWENEQNLLVLGTNTYTVINTEGIIESFTTTTNTFPLPLGLICRNVTGLDGNNTANFTTNATAGIGWCIFSTTGTANSTTTTVQSTWVRERVNGYATAPQGQGWISIGGNSWVRQLQRTPTTQIFDSVVNEQMYIFGVKPNGSTVHKYDNGILVMDALAYLWTCDEPIRSDFFNLNPDNTAPNNSAYQLAAQVTKNLVLFQKTDIKRPYAAQNATTANISMKDLLEKVLGIFNIGWGFVNGVFRVEHISYFEKQQGLDLTIPPYSDYIYRKERFTYKSETIPLYEKFYFDDKTDGFGKTFDGYDIENGEACSNKTGNDENYFDVTTNIGYVTYKSETGNESAIQDTGFCLVSTFVANGNFYVTNFGNGFNDVLGWKFLHEKFWTWNRYLPSVLINKLTVASNSYIKTREQQDIEIPMPCNSLATFNTSNLIKSNLGWGEIESAEYDAKSCFLKIKLIHQ